MRCYIYIYIWVLGAREEEESLDRSSGLTRSCSCRAPAITARGGAGSLARLRVPRARVALDDGRRDVPSEGGCCHERRGPRNSKYMIQTIKLEPRRPRRGGVGEPLRPRRVPPPLLGRLRGSLGRANFCGPLLDNSWRLCDKELLPRRRPRARLVRRRRLVGDLINRRPRRRRRRRGLGH